MIPQTYKDQVARKYGSFNGQSWSYSDWQEMEQYLIENDLIADLILRLEEAALLYAQSKWNEGFEASIARFEDAKTKAKTLVELIQLDAVLAVLDVTKKKFKP